MTVAFAYYYLNPGTKATTVKGVNLAKTIELFEKANADEIRELSCPCRKAINEKLPSFLDNEAECTESSALYKRCIAAVPTAAADQANNGCSDQCDCEDDDKNYSRDMCTKFVRIFADEYSRLTFPTSALVNEDDWRSRAVDNYVEVCEKVLFDQIDQVELTGLSMGLVPGVDLDKFYETTITNYTDHLENNFETICAHPKYDEKSEEFVGPGGEYGPLLANETERDRLHMQYYSSGDGGEFAHDPHYQRCEATSCSYVEDESIIDFAMKTIALFSPIMAAVMTVVAHIYSHYDDHWSEIEDRMLLLGKSDENNKL